MRCASREPSATVTGLSGRAREAGRGGAGGEVVYSAVPRECWRPAACTRASPAPGARVHVHVPPRGSFARTSMAAVSTGAARRPAPAPPARAAGPLQLRVLQLAALQCSSSPVLLPLCYRLCTTAEIPPPCQYIKGGMPVEWARDDSRDEEDEVHDGGRQACQHERGTWPKRWISDSVRTSLQALAACARVRHGQGQGLGSRGGGTDRGPQRGRGRRWGRT